MNNAVYNSTAYNDPLQTAVDIVTAEGFREVDPNDFIPILNLYNSFGYNQPVTEQFQTSNLVSDQVNSPVGSGYALALPIGPYNSLQYNQPVSTTVAQEYLFIDLPSSEVLLMDNHNMLVLA